MTIIGAVITFVIIKAVVDAQNQVGWSSLEVIIMSTLVPLGAALAALYVALRMGTSGK